MGSLTSLAEEILANAKRLDEDLSAHNLNAPNFDNDSLANLPPELESTRKALVDSSQTLKELSQGPVARSVEIMFSVRPLAPRLQTKADTRRSTVDWSAFATGHL